MERVEVECNLLQSYDTCPFNDRYFIQMYFNGSTRCNFSAFTTFLSLSSLIHSGNYEPTFENRNFQKVT